MLLRRDGEIYLFSSNNQWAQMYEQMSCLSDHFLSELVRARASFGKISERAWRDSSGVIASVNGTETIEEFPDTSFAATTEKPEESGNDLRLLISVRRSG